MMDEQTAANIIALNAQHAAIAGTTDTPTGDGSAASELGGAQVRFAAATAVAATVGPPFRALDVDFHDRLCGLEDAVESVLNMLHFFHPHDVDAVRAQLSASDGE